MLELPQLLAVTWAGGGNVNPMVALCAALRAGGHRVRALGPAVLAPDFAPADVAVRAETAGFTAPLPAQAAEIADELARCHADAVIVDYMLPAALCAAEAIGVPTVAFVHTLYTGVAIGPFSPMAMASDVDGINALRAELDLAPVGAVTDLLDRAALVLVTATAALDGASASYPPNVVTVGPLVPGVGALGATATWTPVHPPDEVPLVVVSLGTTPMGEGPVVERLLLALGDLPVQALVTVGDHLDPAAFSPAPNTEVRAYVPHPAVLPQARVLVSHAGLGGIGAALTFGVPLVCVPLGRDQPTNAARVAALGAGCTVAPTATAAELRAAIAAVLADSRYATVAEREADAMARDGGPLARAVDAVEDVLIGPT